jgi:hypothetical protein
MPTLYDVNLVPPPSPRAVLRDEHVRELDALLALALADAGYVVVGQTSIVLRRAAHGDGLEVVIREQHRGGVTRLGSFVLSWDVGWTSDDNAVQVQDSVQVRDWVAHRIRVWVGGELVPRMIRGSTHNRLKRWLELSESRVSDAVAGYLRDHGISYTQITVQAHYDATLDCADIVILAGSKLSGTTGSVKEVGRGRVALLNRSTGPADVAVRVTQLALECIVASHTSGELLNLDAPHASAVEGRDKIDYIHYVGERVLEPENVSKVMASPSARDRRDAFLQAIERDVSGRLAEILHDICPTKLPELRAAVSDKIDEHLSRFRCLGVVASDQLSLAELAYAASITEAPSFRLADWLGAENLERLGAWAQVLRETPAHPGRDRCWLTTWTGNRWVLDLLEPREDQEPLAVPILAADVVRSVVPDPGQEPSGFWDWLQATMFQGPPGSSSTG